MSIIYRIRNFFKRVPRSVTFDEVAVTRTMSDGNVETVRWNELVKVSVITTNVGPWADDVYFILQSRDGGCAVPQSTTGSDLLLQRLQQLPGFRNDEFINAMGSTRNATFICWQREDVA